LLIAASLPALVRIPTASATREIIGGGERVFLIFFVGAVNCDARWRHDSHEGIGTKINDFSRAGARLRATRYGRASRRGKRLSAFAKGDGKEKMERPKRK